MRIRSAFALAFGKVKTGELRQLRFIAILQGVVSGIASRLLSVLIGLLSVPLTIHYLGPERYGAWALIGSTLAWLRLADIGIGNGLNNAIANAFGQDNPALIRTHVSTTLALLSGISILLGIVIALAWPVIEWNSIFNVKTELAKAELGPAMAMSVVIFLVGFPLSVVTRIYVATQDGKLANYWGAAGNLASLAALVAVTHTQGGLTWLVAAVSGTLLVTDLLSGLWLFLSHRPHYRPVISSIRRSSIPTVMNVGMQFFLIQIMALVVFETGNFVVAHYLGADQVPAYNLTYKLFGYTALIQALLFSYVWVAYTEAIARSDIAWVKKSFIINLGGSIASTLVMTVPLIFIARPFIRIWAGDVAVPSYQLVYWMAAWTMINAFCSPIACLLAAAAQMKAQLIYSACSTTMIVFLSITLVKSWGNTGVIAAPVISYLIFICIPLSVDAFLLLKRLDLQSRTAVV